MLIPYQLFWWMFTIGGVFVVGAGVQGELTMCWMLLLFVWHTYLPTLSYILGARVTRSEVLLSEMQSRPVPETTVKSPKHLSYNRVRSDVWLRLFRSKTQTFC